MTQVSNEIQMETKGEPNKEQTDRLLEIQMLTQQHEVLVNTFVVERAKLNGIANEMSAIERKVVELNNVNTE